MEYYRYFDLFLSIEEELAGYMRQLQFALKTPTTALPGGDRTENWQVSAGVSRQNANLAGRN